MLFGRCSTFCNLPTESEDQNTCRRPNSEVCLEPDVFCYGLQKPIFALDFRCRKAVQKPFKEEKIKTLLLSLKFSYAHLHQVGRRCTKTGAGFNV